MNDILNDASKFVTVMRNPVEEIKRKLDNTFEKVNAIHWAECLPMVGGDHDLGYIYDTVKTHKWGNPLRPIISQIPSPTYAVNEALNRILTPVVPSRYSLESFAEFLQALRDHPSQGIIASLDMESLFTNVGLPVDETADLILNKVYRGNHGKTNIPEEGLKKLLQICTKEAPFTDHRGHMHQQCDGVTMGSPLGVLFANFYMGVTEEGIFSTLTVPSIYLRTGNSQRTYSPS